MKIRNSFVTNSSSVNFFIVNTSNKTLTMKDFFLENSELFREIGKKLKELHWYAGDLKFYTELEILDALETYQIKSGDILYRDVGEERYDDLDYVLYVCETECGRSKNFIWKREHE